MIDKNSDVIITIITPTFNRSSTLKRLFDSLLKQSSFKFKWLIIDDGSTDDTSQVVKKFFNDKFEVEYYKKENGGKHRALNFGIKEINTPLTFIVDSDDWISELAIEKIMNYYNKYKNYEYICGFSFLRQFPDGKINGKLFYKNELIDTYFNVRVLGKDMKADKAEVFFTNILKINLFPEFENEKFLGEDILWLKLSKSYKMIHINEAIYIGNYQDDGLTKNRRKNNMKNPMGCYNRAKMYLSFKLPFILRAKNIMQLIIYGGEAHIHIKDIITKNKSHILFLFLYVPSLFLRIKWKMGAKK